jgi:16S rRNA (adenine1518-N6/adenine1519-N6)-dimethyltransferase
VLPRAKKRLGQHFLTDRHYLSRIVEAIDPARDDRIVEIGPGTGLLTEALLERVATLHVVEVDRDLAQALRERFDPQRLSVHEADVLVFDFGSLPKPLRVVGNLPYNISTPILFRIAAIAGDLVDATFMLQKEVVDRMVAAPGHADYGRLSVMLQYRFEMATVLRVPPGAFTPAPKVESAVVRMRPLAASRARAGDEKAFAQIVAAAFGQRRKTLRNAVRSIAGEAAFEAAGIDPGRRGETLSVAEFIRLADAAATRAG